ncbi:mycofactocin-coupled SDR family oxidoreductase [Amycolatopsis acidiphila]|uniref:NAD(P)-dependent oxidoreductase n=1 Tax=Amycolatopsis acidiphila TaxID=715473 RepID=A0A558AJ77_9PSEU|nr:mycofactocin-coupled SDR family oxidoreductase [Amycolatopsis acidiphila]TVT24315.1 NAD(P)-dependent oxidoreductase [Amycolatopsis acidiphila]UIJ62552.1 mycofactocin-coupled SDR family oxidoreductase [Amycolatopsis acidiphila]GHG85377.1 3-ketoacyl-ACP reductase [Amycolatopsis acidiphila]
MGQLDGKVAVITGGGRGQGRSHAVRLAEEGADIVVCDITEQVGSVPFPTGRPGDLDETVVAVEKTGRRCVALEADVRSTADMTRLADTAMREFGRIDILLANAGILSLSENTWELSDEAWDDMIGINLTGVFKACRAVVPHIRAGGRGGSVVITSSIAGLRGVAGCTHYTAAKHGIVGLMRTLACELAPESIRVNTIHPTGVDSPMSNNDYFPQWLEEHKELGDAMRYNLMPVDAMPVRDVSEVVVFLVSDAGKWITGTTQQIDAGFMLK